MIDGNEMAEIEAAMMDGVCEGTCNECGHTQTVEPDASFPCPECGAGNVQSVLRKHWLI